MEHLYEYDEFVTGKNMKFLSSGTEGDVWTDGIYAYKIVPSDMVGTPEEIKRSLIGKNFKNVVNTYDVYYDNGKTVIKMELLNELPEVEDGDEFHRVRKKLWRCNDDVGIIRNITTENPVIRKMLNGILNGIEELGRTTDIGFHNLLYDPKTDEYKLVDVH